MSANRIFKSVLAFVVALSKECSCTSDCEVPFSAKASVLVQRARTAAQAPILPEVHRTDARRRRGFGAENRSGDLVSHDQLEDVGIKIAKEQMESVQDGIVAMQTVDRDMVDRTMKEMSDMQRFFMRLVASLLFGNVLVILAMFVPGFFKQKSCCCGWNSPGAIATCSCSRCTVIGRKQHTKVSCGQLVRRCHLFSQQYIGIASFRSTGQSSGASQFRTSSRQ